MKFDLRNSLAGKGISLLAALFLMGTAQTAMADDGNGDNPNSDNPESNTDDPLFHRFPDLESASTLERLEEIKNSPALEENLNKVVELYLSGATTRQAEESFLALLEGISWLNFDPTLAAVCLHFYDVRLRSNYEAGVIKTETAVGELFRFGLFVSRAAMGSANAEFRHPPLKRY